MEKQAHITTDSDYRDLGPAIEAARDAVKMSKAELARRIGVTRTAVVKMESGERRVDVVELCRIADAIGIGRLDLFRLATERVASGDGYASGPEQSMSADEELLALVS